MGRYETGKDRYIEGKAFTNGLSSQDRHALWSRDMWVKEKRRDTKVAGQICQNGLRMFDCCIRVKNAIKINFITVVTNYLHYWYNELYMLLICDIFRK